MGCSDSGGCWGYRDYSPAGQRKSFPEEYVQEHGLQALVVGLREDAKREGKRNPFLVALDAMQTRLDAATKAACELSHNNISDDTRTWLKEHSEADTIRDVFDPEWRKEVEYRRLSVEAANQRNTMAKIAKLEQELAEARGKLF